MKAEHISKVKYLGYSFYRHKGKCRFRVRPKSVTKMKNKIRELTDRNNGMSNTKREGNIGGQKNLYVVEKVTGVWRKF